MYNIVWRQISKKNAEYKNQYSQSDAGNATSFGNLKRMRAKEKRRDDVIGRAPSGSCSFECGPGVARSQKGID